MIADLSTNNANVVCDLGIRHAVQRGRTILIGSEAAFALPFNINNLFIQRYEIGAHGALSREQADRLREILRAALKDEMTAIRFSKYVP